MIQLDPIKAGIQQAFNTSFHTETFNGGKLEPHTIYAVVQRQPQQETDKPGFSI